MRKFLWALVTVLLFFHAAPIAEAHSTLISSNPKSGATLKAVPTLVTLTFNENLLVIADKQPNVITVTSASGQSITASHPKVSGNRISVSLRSKKILGKLRVSYRVVSADGHPIAGSFFFTVK